MRDRSRLPRSALSLARRELSVSGCPIARSTLLSCHFGGANSDDSNPFGLPLPTRFLRSLASTDGSLRSPVARNNAAGFWPLLLLRSPFGSLFRVSPCQAIKINASRNFAPESLPYEPPDFPSFPATGTHLTLHPGDQINTSSSLRFVRLEIGRAHV